MDQPFAYLYDQLQAALIPQALQIAFTLAPVMLAFILAVIFWDLWVDYVRSKQFLGLKYTILEIKLPKETNKSPQAMEIVLNSLHNTSDGSMFAQFWKGETRPWYSLEMISIEGQVKFLIWTEDRRKQGVMNAVYSQYPEVEIKEMAEDYSKGVQFDPKIWKVWAAEFKLTKSDAYPIKTYVDYGLDKDPKEEYKVDPLLPLLEFLGSVGPNQQVWVQILIRAHKKEQRKPGHLFVKYDAWKAAAEKEINEILKRDPKTKVAGDVNPETGWAKLPTISKPEQDIVEALGRSVSKLPFDVGIRAYYLAKKEIFNTPFGIGGLIGNMKHFNTEHLNGFAPNGDKWTPSLSDPWQDYHDMRRNRFSRVALKAYRRRSYFYQPFMAKPFVLNSEELATIYHFPGSVAATPTLERVPSKRAQAPGNLPV